MVFIGVIMAVVVGLVIVVVMLEGMVVRLLFAKNSLVATEYGAVGLSSNQHGPPYYVSRRNRGISQRLVKSDCESVQLSRVDIVVTEVQVEVAQ